MEGGDQKIISEKEAKRRMAEIAMNPVRLLVAIIGFLLVWFVVAVVAGFVMALLFPPAGGATMVGIGTSWRNLPGTILGLLAGIQSFRASMKAKRK